MKRLASPVGFTCFLALLLSTLNIARTAANEAAISGSPVKEDIATSPPAQSTAAAEKAAAEKAIVVARADPIVPVPVPRPSIPLEVTPDRAAPTAPARFFTINQVLAKHRRGGSRSSAATLAALDPAGTASDAAPIAIQPLQSDEPFGLFTFHAPQGPLWVKWRGVEADVKAEASSLARCEADPSLCSRAQARFAAIIKDARTQQGRARLELVNRRVNDALRYVADIVHWNEADRWSAPLDKNGKGSFDTGLGDCEDYAIAKYAALRRAGLAAKDLRLLLVRDNAVRLAHAVLAAREDGRWLILDNRWSRLLDDTQVRRFTPLFALDDHGVKLFAAPYATNLPALSDDPMPAWGGSGATVEAGAPATGRSVA